MGDSHTSVQVLAGYAWPLRGGGAGPESGQTSPSQITPTLQLKGPSQQPGVCVKAFLSAGSPPHQPVKGSSLAAGS